DPVPRHLQEALDEMDGKQFEPLVEELRRLPLRESSRVGERLMEVRRALADVMSEIWSLTLQKARFQSPLLILDEAHHLKNPSTRLASLFVDEEAARESVYFESGGALGGKFDRMLFLTATPFQLGHGELIRVLERFEGINWQSRRRPAITRDGFREEISGLASALDDAQAAALRLDRAWARLGPDHILNNEGDPFDSDRWWQKVQADPGEGVVGQVIAQVDATAKAMRAAEALLRPWVLRHLKSRYIASSTDIERRRVLPGAAIIDGERTSAGLEIEGDALFPFLLAGRAQAIMSASARGRALFAEGLSSSFGAYFETRSEETAIDEDADLETSKVPEEIGWYLDHLDRALPRDSDSAFELHPKIRATSERAVQLWKAGEKVLIFCHYRATGKALRRHISSRLEAEIIRLGLQRLPGVAPEKIREELERISARFFDSEGALRNQVTHSIESIVRQFDRFDSEAVQSIVDVVRRFLRTPSFLVRYFDLARTDYVGAFAEAIERQDLGGLSLRRRIEDFCAFLADRCVASEREDYLKALDRIQVGSHVGRDVFHAFDPSEGAEEARQVQLLPNVRLVNGRVIQDTRRRLLLAFNTPLFPEILIASSVLAEGVDLHLNCRYVIHHDLCWNPSTLEQRTGRVDRLGSKAEQIRESIHVYLPYIAATRDEKMYRVVRDRERWFQIVMGERYEVDEAATDRRSERVPLPRSVQERLIMNLERIG
ncbi:MAG TPA: helicase-related protein, partial [Blastocatellia bacterium]|nr:helicase-related protein [Blastocatellia bacterium]